MKRFSIVVTMGFVALLMIFGCGGSGGSDITSEDDSQDPIIPTTEIRMGATIDGIFENSRIALSIDENEALAPGGAITATVELRDSNGNLYLTPVEVNFSSNLAAMGLAEIEAVKTTNNGTAQVVYRASGGSGVDTITARAEVGDDVLIATATILVEGNEAMHIAFVSADPLYIALKNTGGPPRSETSNLVFRVTDNNGDPVANQVVDFALSTEIGGLSLSVSEDTSDNNGLVRTTVNSGTVSTEVKVQATVRDSLPVITIVSDTLIISTGLADQNSISLSNTPFNPEGWNYNNVEVPVIFQAADHFNNFVPDGTVVYFSTELASIDESCVLEDGVCKVIWRSGNPRYSYCDGDTPACQPGVSTITAFLIGEESFYDINGNGYFDPADVFDINSDVAEPYRDDNWNGIWDAGEPFWDYDVDGVFDDTPNGIYNGSLCSDDAEAQGLCTKELVYVQAQTQIVMSGSFAFTFTLSPAVLDLRGQTSGILQVSIKDVNGNPMPAGSTLSIETTNGEALIGSSFEIPNTVTATEYTFIIVPTEGDGDTGTLYATLETPFGNLSISSNSVTVLDDN